LLDLFYRKVLTLPQTYFDNETSGKIANQLNRGIMSISGFFNTAATFIFPVFLQAIFVITILSFYSGWIALCVGLLFPSYILISKLSDNIYRKYQKEMNAIDDLIRGRIIEVLGNIKLVKGFSNQLAEIGFVNGRMKELVTIHNRQSNMYHAIDFARNSGLHIILFVINAIIFYQTFLGRFSVGEMVYILQLVTFVRWSLFGMSYLVSQIQTADTDSAQFFELLELPSTEKLPTTSKAKSVLKGTSIKLENIAFAYESSRDVLKGVTFELGDHQTVALVGKSGAGKSTLTNLIMRFYEPQSGTICMDDIPYARLSHHAIRDQIALVFQENELFSTTIRDNVAYGMKATDAQIYKALEMANAREFVEKLPQKLDAQVGERGVKLSGGQKQRIQIARAILKDAPILILDEATSNLDAQSEREVQKALDSLMKDKLVLVIAHRFSTLQDADRIIVLDGGVISDQGTPAELSKRHGIYSDLLRFQVEGNKKLLESYDIY
jgi:ATP-binding cassette subfamily B protein